eukprot:Phypoly_transcript_15813.p1 GENE.Phypoly_transcript_15813~~Phypoly_transcript_15813.p1  ORF type:complete len:283 (+),score=30.89 Phypoly_transcript_15813:98-850(+)
MTSSINGKMTYYSGGGGECSFGDGVPLYNNNKKAFFSTVAMVTQYYAGSKTCGACLNVTSKGTGGGHNPIPSGSFMVFVDNECPTCESGGLDSNLGLDGAWDMEWTLIECPMPSSKPNIQFAYQGSNPYYIKIQVRNTRVPVSNVFITQGGKEVELVRTTDNFWNAPKDYKGFPITTPIPIRIVSILGDSIRDSVPKLSSDGVYDGSTQFPSTRPGGDKIGASTSSFSLSLHAALLLLFCLSLSLANMAL